jgi:Putative prokaryotic signal transducing protein
MNNSKNKFQTALSSTNSAFLSVAKSILDEAGINYSVLNNGSATEIQVSGDDVFKARNLLHELEELDFETSD